MMFENILDESISMEIRANPALWKSVMSLWSKLAELEKVRVTDEGMFYNFQCFFSSFMRKTGKKPTIQDALKFAARN